MADRLEQLLGVVSLAAMDRLRDGIGLAPEARAVGGEAEAGALVHLQAWPGASMTELVGVVGRSQPATVRLVDRLVDRGLVRRDTGPDRRTVALSLTQAGERVAGAILTARAGALAPLLAGLSDDERASLEEILGRVSSRLAGDRRGAVRACRLCHRAACMSGPGCPMEHTTTPGSRRPRVFRPPSS